jgi:hypothetical protein
MARCPKCLILEGSPGALACEMERCPRSFADLNFADLRRATGDKPAHPTSVKDPVPISAQMSKYQRAGHTPPKPGSRPRGRPRKVIDPRPTAPVTVYDRDAGVGALPPNLR